MKDNDQLWSDKEILSKSEMVTLIYEKRLANLENEGHTIIYCSGIARSYPGIGAWAFSAPDESRTIDNTGDYKNTTSSRMEIVAMIKALENTDENSKLVLVVDSEYVFDCINKGWVAGWADNNWRNGKGRLPIDIDLWKQYYKLHQRLQPIALYIPADVKIVPFKDNRSLVNESMKSKNLLQDTGFHLTKKHKIVKNKNKRKWKKEENLYTSTPRYRTSI